MAIKRCPYCRSIIDEVDRYCQNCGTQLLFPEDEGVEEDIPGERIVEAEDKASEEEAGIEIESPVEEPPPAPPERSPRETALFTRGGIGTEEGFPKKPPAFEPVPEKPKPFATRDLPEMDIDLPPAAPPSRTGRFVAKEEKPKPSGDFEAGFPTSAEEIDDISRLMSKVEKQPLPRTSPPPTPPFPEKPAFSEKDLPPLRFDEEKPATPDELPPWAERVKDGVTPGFRAPTGGDQSRELGDLSLETVISDRPLYEEAAEDVGPEEDEFSRLSEPELLPRPRRRKRGPLARLKARVYDVLIIALLWVAALWASSKVLGVPLFTIVQDSGLQVGLFFLVLIAGYFALFLFFLGETLGDRLSSTAS